MAADKATNNSTIEWSERERKIALEVLLGVSSAKRFALDQDEGVCPFLLGASRVNTDLNRAAQCEADGGGDGMAEDGSLFDFIRSPAYWRLREAFVEDAASGDRYSLVRAVWRAYNAGLLSQEAIHKL